MSDPALGLTMLGLIVIAIMMGFPTAFTLMGLGMIFGYIAFWAPGQHWYDNRIFDLIVQRTYGVMTNDTLLSIPLFVYMGYIMERAALIDRMFHSVQLAFRRVPASLAVTTMLVCAFWGIASGIVGAVVILVGVIAMRPMLNAGYDVRLASGVITAGGTLGILIPPSVMLIVYAAVAGQSIVKLYAAAMIPGFFLTFLYLVYILGWAIINPKIAPKLPPDQYRLTVPDYIKRLERGRSKRVIGGLIAAAFRPSMVEGATAVDGRPARYGLIVKDVLSRGGAGGADRRHLRCDMVVCPHLQCPGGDDRGRFGSADRGGCSADGPAEPQKPQALGTPEQMPQELGEAETEVKSSEPQQSADAPPEEISSVTEPGVAGAGKVPAHFFEWFWGLAAFSVLVLAYYFWRMDGEGLEILKELVVSVVPLGVLTVVVLAVILFGICTATESAAVGALGALYLAVMAKYPRQVWWWSLVGAIGGVVLGWAHADFVELLVSGSLGATFLGTVVPVLMNLRTSASFGKTSSKRRSSRRRRPRWSAGCSSARRFSPPCSRYTAARG